MPSTFIYVVVLYVFSSLTHASTLLLRQYQDSSYTTCAQHCFEPLVNASGCPFDLSDTRNACLCSSNSFLTNFMICTFKSCGGPVLAETAKTAVNNCAFTNTPAVLPAEQLVSVGQGIGSSGTSAGSSPTVSSPTPSTSISSQVTSPSSSPSPTTTASSMSSATTTTTSSMSATFSNAASGTASYPTTSTTSSNPPSSTPSASGGSAGLDNGAIVGIVFGIVGAIGVVVTIITCIRQWNTRPPGARPVRDVGNWFCGCGRSYRRDEMPMRPYPQRNGYP